MRRSVQNTFFTIRTTTIAGAVAVQWALAFCTSIKYCCSVALTSMYSRSSWHSWLHSSRRSASFESTGPTGRPNSWLHLTFKVFHWSKLGWPIITLAKSHTVCSILRAPDSSACFRNVLISHPLTFLISGHSVNDEVSKIKLSQWQQPVMTTWATLKHVWIRLK